MGNEPNERQHDRTRRALVIAASRSPCPQRVSSVPTFPQRRARRAAGSDNKQPH
jgi:hypothetical protein